MVELQFGPGLSVREDSTRMDAMGRRDSASIWPWPFGQGRRPTRIAGWSPGRDRLQFGPGLSVREDEWVSVKLARWYKASIWPWPFGQGRLGQASMMLQEFNIASIWPWPFGQGRRWLLRGASRSGSRFNLALAFRSGKTMSARWIDLVLLRASIWPWPFGQGRPDRRPGGVPREAASIWPWPFGQGRRPCGRTGWAPCGSFNLALAFRSGKTADYACSCSISI